jgi:hypothetical protein
MRRAVFRFHRRRRTTVMPEVGDDRSMRQIQIKRKQNVREKNSLSIKPQSL